LYFEIKKKKVKKDKDKGQKGKDATSSLIVAALKRLLPVGLNLFAGREQELVQHCKDRFLQVTNIYFARRLFNSHSIFFQIHILENG